MNQEEVLIPIGLCAIKQLKKTNENLVFRPNSTIIATECLKYLSHNRKKDQYRNDSYRHPTIHQPGIALAANATRHTALRQ